MDEATAEVVKCVSVQVVVPLGVPRPNPIPDDVGGLTVVSVTATAPAPAVNVKKTGAPCGLSEPENVAVVVESLGDVDPGGRLHPQAAKAATISSHLVHVRTLVHPVSARPFAAGDQDLIAGGMTAHRARQRKAADAERQGREGALAR